MKMATGLSSFGAVVLAAGLSSRMGGPNKLLELYSGKPLLAHALETVAGLGLMDCVVVTGRDQDRVAMMAKQAGVRFIHNTQPRDGMGRSIAAGVGALNKNNSGNFIVLGDMPHITANDFLTLATRFTPRSIIVPRFGEQRGHPVLFSSAYRSRLLTLTGDIGARAVIKAHISEVIEVEMPHAGILIDFDQPDDFLRQGLLPSP